MARTTSRCCLKSEGSTIPGIPATQCRARSASGASAASTSADQNNGGVRLDLLYVPGMSGQGYILAVGTTTTPTLEPGIEARIAHFEGDVQKLLSGTWTQCVDTHTQQ